jgi:hypothetical protein
MEIIKIPNVTRDERIGSAFNDLFRVIDQTECAADMTVVWDFSDSCFFHPFFLAPLSIFLNSCSKKIECINIPERIQLYFDTVHFITPLQISSMSDVTQLKQYQSRSYIPICRFNPNDIRINDAMQSVIQYVIEHQSNADVTIKTPLSYFLGELICNISQHSYCDHGYIYSQYLSREKCVDICIADAGITVYGSYIRAGKYVDKIGDSETAALIMANEGFSTKDLPDAENRGYGISTTKKMLVEGLKGEFFMLSGSAFHRHLCTEAKFIQLPDTFRWEGTVILMRIPVNVPPEFDYSKYII